MSEHRPSPEEPEPPSPEEDEALEEIAQVWLARRDRGLTPLEKRELAAWLAEDPRHGIILAQLEGPFKALDRAAVLRPPLGTYPDPDLLLAKSPGIREAPRRFRVPWLVGAGLAATLALGLGLFRMTSSPEPALAVAGGSMVRHAPEQRQLADGSVVELKAGSHVEVAFTETERRVQLEKGEAHFTVAPHAGRPFVVVAGDVAVRAVGTAFSVNREPAGVEVLVTEGQVHVGDVKTDPALLRTAEERVARREFAVALLTAGHRVVIPAPAPSPASGAVTTLAPEEIERALAWRRIWLEFIEMPLAQVVEEINGQAAAPTDPRLMVADATTGRVLVTGRFRVGSVDVFVRLLESGFGIVATPLADGRLELRQVQ